MILLLHEIKENRKSLLIWSLTVGLICYGCILLYKSVAGQLAEVADLYANMGEMTKALGLDKVSLATLDGYYATEIALMFGLGAGMFAAMLGVNSLSKEEEGHTSEFLFTLPYQRKTILLWKYLSVLVLILAFNAIAVGLSFLGIWQLDMTFSYQSMLQYHLLALLMQLELASLGFLISAISSKKQTGLAMGLVLLTYSLDMMVRIVPDLDKLKYLSPYYYASGADVFSQVDLDILLLIKAGVVILASLLFSVMILEKKDLKA